MVRPNGEAEECAESHLLDDYDCCWFSAHVVAADLTIKRPRYKPQPRSVFQVKSFMKELPPKQIKVLMWIGIASWGCLPFGSSSEFSLCSMLAPSRRYVTTTLVQMCQSVATQ